jgi:tRNA wybutosine-synthesizing protein 1
VITIAASILTVAFKIFIESSKSAKAAADENEETQHNSSKSIDDIYASEQQSKSTLKTDGESQNVESDNQLIANAIGENLSHYRRVLSSGCITIVHASVTGTCSTFAKELHTALSTELKTSTNRYSVQQGSVEEFDWWDELLNDDSASTHNTKHFLKPVLILLLPTNINGTWPECSSSLKNALEDVQNDWRVENQPLKAKLQTAVFGMGSSEYHDSNGKLNMGQPAKIAARYFQKLGAKCIAKVRVGDDAVGNHAQDTFELWKNDVLQALLKNKDGTVDANKMISSTNKNRNVNPTNGIETKTKSFDKRDDTDTESEFDNEDEPADSNVLDLEDMGDVMSSQKTSIASDVTEMVTPSQSRALRKEGYKLIGTHSAVKLCRWTKHQLRGRGGCYKHTFYGITSYQCMEATPSLACANKCVFCWRHHKNPVGKEWRWKTDDPNFIVEEAIKKHVQMIKETKGIPGVQLDRWKEAHTVRHCALSLVGEPIMYPRIDELLADLHRRQISSFLVTNGQHPDAIKNLRPVTQLYVSVDAPTEESLIAIDRPLFNDAWERLKLSLTSLKDRGQRTVARLTVVKGWNADEVEGYARLIALGQVSLVEVKGVTYCGKSDASNLNMSNTPWHHEVVELTQTLKREIDKLRKRDGEDVCPEYDIACEHKHSCSVLLARVDTFSEWDQVTGKRTWKTWIDYPKFNELARLHATDPTFTFSALDYVADTPSWALFGAEEEGFDPSDKRHRRNTKHPLYTQFDSRGVPTHDHLGNLLVGIERERLNHLMDEKLNEIGTDPKVLVSKGGSKEIQDVTLMFRGLTVTM